ncbi:hypothetical protein [Nocardia vaccinii]|uniref:hypothetical protein n=1 Tax=Nocardia vaccinii TaxID=1822 RepID=UPI0008344E40|nr:hypothetical protein [Nocardia vaccinii]
MSSTFSQPPYHNRPGESIADILSVPIVLLFLVGGAGAGLALISAAEHAYGWAALAGGVGAVCFFAAITLIVLEHQKLSRREHRVRPPWNSR